MVYKRLPNNTPEILRRYGLSVVEISGWQTRGRSAKTGGFNPVGVLCHHTATGTSWTNNEVRDLLVGGRKDLPGPLVQFGLDRKGVVYLVASGRCNHAGTARASGSVAGGDGNELYIGIEGYNDGRGEKWSPVQYAAYVLLCAVLSIEFTKGSAQTVRGHKETSTSGKPDPLFDMNKFRAEVAETMIKLKKPQVKESVVTSKPGPKYKHNGKVGSAGLVEHKTPLGKEFSVASGERYSICTINIPKPGRYLLTVQIRMPADTTSTARTEMVRLGWPGLAAKDSTGHNKIPSAEKIGDDWFRWNTYNHCISGGGDVSFDIVMPKGNAKMRAVIKAERIS